MNIKSIARRATLSAVAIATLGAGAVVATAPAEAAFYPWMKNSSASDEWIRYYSYGNPSNGRYLYPGDNESSTAPNPDIAINDIRVDVDTTGSTSRGVDVDSYKIGDEGNGYGPCHVGETDASNPPDTYTAIIYRNYTNSSCS